VSTPPRRASAVFVMPRRSTEWADAPAMWITAAGWAAAARDRYGAAWVVTPDAVATPETALGYTRHAAATPAARRGRSWIPTEARTAVKDALRWRAARRFRAPEGGPWTGTDVELVWQHHDLFHRGGEDLARGRGCPLVSYVHAPQVWEAAKWGVRRPGWGRALERFGEVPQLLRSDVVACVSDEVAAELARLGVDEHRILVSPMAVDAGRFDPAVSSADLRTELGVDGCTVIGWTGSFRRFHGLDGALDAFRIAHAQRPRLRLLLVGDGAERSRMTELATQLGVGDAVVFTGAVGHEEIPRYVRAMDIAVVVARADEDFHYSPLKMREYMAAAVPVVAPRLGEVPRVLTDGTDGLLYAAGDATGLAERLVRLDDDPALRERVGRAGLEVVLRTGTWAVQLDRLVTSAPFLEARARRSGDTGQ